MPLRNMLRQPYALERTIVRAHPALRSQGCTVSVDHTGLTVTAEIRQPEADPTQIEQAVRLALALRHGLDLHEFIPRRPAAA